MTFDQWKHAVDMMLQRQCGFTSDDLPDHAYYDAWEDGVSPEEVSREVLYDYGFTFDEDVSED